MVIARKAAAKCPKKVASVIDLANIPSTLRDFVGQSQISRLHCFFRVWAHIKARKLQDPINKNVVNCDAELKPVLLGKDRVHLAEIPSLIKLHFPREQK